MCGRYSMALGNEELYDALEARLPRMFEQGRPRWERPQDHHPRYNVAPRQRAPVIRRDPEDGTRAMIETMQWGLIPHWTKHPPSGGLNTINARSEGLLDASSGGMWHALKGYKRCIVPAQGYYEWLKKPSTKIPHFTRLPLGPKNTNASPPLIFFAGLYDIVKYQSPVESRFQPSEAIDPDTGEKLDNREPYPTGNPIPLATFTILTTTPSKDISWLHDRMPCVLNSWEEIERWLDLGEGEMKGWEEGKGGTGELLKGFPGLDCFPVPPEVGKISTNSPTFIQPVSERSDGIKSFFQKQQPSPAKPKSVPTPKDTKPIESVQPAKKEADDDVKVKAEGMTTELGSEEEKGLGDDSNAPNPEDDTVKEEDADRVDEAKVEVGDVKSEPESTPSKRKRTEDVMDADDGREGDEEVKPAKQERKGGHQTKVVRRTSDDTNKDQPAITNFFKSPQAAKAPPQPPGKTRGGKRGKK